MIRSFKCKETEKIFLGEVSRKFPVKLQTIARRKLLYLKNAQNLNDLLIPPGNQLERLSGDRKGYYSIRVNRQWRLCFSWSKGDAHHVEMVDYH